MIILEGADCVGKTTAAQAICEIIQKRYAPTVHHTKLYGHMSKPDSSFDHFSDYISMVREGVQDRFHLGSIVYGRMLGCGNYPTSRKMRSLQRYLSWAGCYVVIMTAERRWLYEKLQKSLKEEMYSVEQILDANECYRALADTSNRGVKWCDASWDVTAKGWPKAEDLEKFVDAWRERWTA